MGSQPDPDRGGDPAGGALEVPGALFQDLFADAIRVLLDWGEVRARSLSARIEFATSYLDVQGDYFPWYLGESGEEVVLGGSARPIALAEFPAVEERLLPSRRKRIDELREGFTRWGSVQLLVPAYRVGRSRLILDGCHRLAALAGCTVSVRVVFFTLHGPPDPRVLPDLTHWQG